MRIARLQQATTPSTSSTTVFRVAFVGAIKGSILYDAQFDGGTRILTFQRTWNVTKPNGVIDLFNDIFGVAFQFGHDCT